PSAPPEDCPSRTGASRVPGWLCDDFQCEATLCNLCLQRFPLCHPVAGEAKERFYRQVPVDQRPRPVPVDFTRIVSAPTKIARAEVFPVYFGEVFEAA